VFGRVAPVPTRYASCNVRYRLANRGPCHTRYTRLRYVVASVGKMDIVGKVAQTGCRPIRPVSLLRGVPF
jgi:hypothetical protein